MLFFIFLTVLFPAIVSTSVGSQAAPSASSSHNSAYPTHYHPGNPDSIPNSNEQSFQNHRMPALRSGAHKIHHYDFHRQDHTNTTLDSQWLSHSNDSETTTSIPRLIKTTPTHSDVVPSSGATGLWGQAAGPTHVFPKWSPLPQRFKGTQLKPAVALGKAPNNPENWRPTADHKFNYAEEGKNNPDTAHLFAVSNIKFLGPTIALDHSDGVADIRCDSNTWFVDVRDEAHMSVAKTWKKGDTLVQFTFCDAGNARMFLNITEIHPIGMLKLKAIGELMDFEQTMAEAKGGWGHYNPDATDKLKRDVKPTVTTIRNPVITPPPSTHELHERGLWSKAKSGLGHITSGIASVVSDATQGAVSIATEATSAIGSVASAATSEGASVISDVSSKADSVVSQATSAVGSVASEAENFSKTMGASWSVSHPSYPPTSSSPFGPAVTNLWSIDNIDVWDLGVGIVGTTTLTGTIAADFVKLKVNTAQVQLTTKGFEMNFPIGLDAHAADVQHSFTFPFPPIPEEVSPFGIETEWFKCGLWFEIDVNATIGVKASGKYDLGVNLSIPNAQATLDMADSSQNNESGWKPDIKKWFKTEDGTAELKASFGFDFSIMIGLNVTKMNLISAHAQLTDSVALEAKALIDIPGSDLNDNKNIHKRDLRGVSAQPHRARRRGFSLHRRHPRDILLHEFEKGDTCAAEGGIPFELDFADNVFLGADLGPIDKTIGFWSWTTPLWTTCFSTAQPRGTHEALANGISGTHDDHDVNNNNGTHGFHHYNETDAHPFVTHATPTIIAHQEKPEHNGTVAEPGSTSHSRHPEATLGTHHSLNITKSTQ
ncbi:MAG: hypothetical protein M1820_008803 [Bogoriella megaspora]|nr:MAG: hypothetical protein M1820_008803 [Bogoriella megaspora]